MVGMSIAAPASASERSPLARSTISPRSATPVRSTASPGNSPERHTEIDEDEDNDGEGGHVFLRSRIASVLSLSAFSRMNPSASFWSYAPRSSSNVTSASE